MHDLDPTPPEPTRSQLETQLQETEDELAAALDRVAELESTIADARELLDQSFYGLEHPGPSLYNEQGVNQAHRALSGGSDV